MKVRIDMTKCLGFGTCADLAPAVFRLDEFGYAEVLNGGVVPLGEAVRVCDAVRKCAQIAIVVDEDTKSKDAS